ncbi:MAG: cupredoxin domain-containing protein [Dehalococcoidia bacterium]
MQGRRIAVACLLIATFFGLAVAACGGDDSDPVTTPGASGTPAERGAKTPDAEGTIVIVARNLEFDTDELLAPAGAVTIEFENADGGTPHNIHFFRGANARGESVGETALGNGPATDTLELDLETGDYFFQCDVHPNMKGTLTVA